MSSVKIKNATVKALQAAIASGTLPAGTEITGEIRGGRLWINIDAAPFDALKPQNITPNGFRVNISLGSDEDTDHTPEALALLATVKEIVKANAAPLRCYVAFSQVCYMAQVKRARAA